ncbi:restriction endonuclease [Candidatus Pacearchaeota archaeon]|nr:restriction endonuclease [Candidatus Pacearchaeota archaeon]
MYQKEVFSRYKSNSQIIRVLSENWFDTQMYCPYCLNEEIEKFPNNNKSGDFYCIRCKNIFELKSSNKAFSMKVIDGEYFTMINCIKLNKTPNFSLLNYDKKDLVVKNLFIIPKFFVSESIIEKRNPLSEAAKRKGWIGCNILLQRIPEEGRVQIINNEKIIPKETVSKIINKMYFLHNKSYETRGWTSDILVCIEKLSKKEFTLEDIYKFESYLKKLHPNNNFIKEKIRQQLQILRDNNILEFLNNGKYKFKRS